MSNSLAGVNVAQIAQKTLDTMVAKLPVVNLFSTDFSSDVAVEGSSVTTRIAQQPTAGSLETGYADNEQASNCSAVTITLGDVTGFVIGFTDSEWSKSSINIDEIFVKPGVNAVSGKVVNDALKLVTNAKFGAAVYNSNVSGVLTVDDVAEMAGDLSDSNVPSDDRFLLVRPTLFTDLCKDDAVKYMANYGDASALKMREIPNLGGFKVAEYSGIPSNSENLIGMVGHKSAIVIATRVPATPEPFNGEVANVTDPESGLTIQVRKWYSADKGKHYLSMGIIYGVKEANTTALGRIVSA